MSIPPGQLSSLASLDKPKSIKALAEENGSPYDSTYSAVRALQAEGIVQVRREGRLSIVQPTSLRISSLARALIHEVPRQDWSAVFHGQRPIFLHVLDRVRDPALAAEICGLSRSTAYHAIKTHAPKGLLQKDAYGYRINPRLQQLKVLLVEWNMLYSTRRVQELDPQAVIVWRLGPEALFRSHLRLPKVPLGGPSAFPKFGVELISHPPITYYLSWRRLTASDAIHQAMLLDPEGASKIDRSYCALVYEKAKPRDFLEKAPIYETRTRTGHLERAEALLQYVERHEGAEFLPWKEYQRFRRQYGVDS